MKPEPLKGHLDFLLLAVLEAKAAHGYAIIEELRRHSRGAFDLAEGTIYPALHRLEEAGLLASRWQEHAGRRRRLYRLSRRGRRVLARQRQAWRRFSQAVDLVARMPS